MKLSLVISLLIHSILILGLFWKPSSFNRLTRKVSPVELISNQPYQASRKKQIKGSKFKKKTKIIKSEDSFPEKVSEKKQGSSHQDLQEIKSKGAQTSQSKMRSYGSELQEYIQRNRYYPKRAMLMEHTGQVVLRLVITAEGVFDTIEIIKPASHESLNRAAKQLLTNLKAFKPLPKEFSSGSREFIVPVNYQLKSGSI